MFDLNRAMTPLDLIIGLILFIIFMISVGRLFDKKDKEQK